MTRGLWRRIGNVAEPRDAAAREALFSVEDGEDFVSDSRKLSKRNLQQEKLFFAMRDLVADAKGTAPTITKEWLLEVTGFFDVVWYPDGRFSTRPRSIASMGAEIFREFFNAAIPKMQQVLEVSNRDDLLRQYFDYLDPTSRAVAKSFLAAPPRRRRISPRYRQGRLQDQKQLPPRRRTSDG
jgi:hypothetical protein